MIVRTLREVQGTAAEIASSTWISRRLLLAGDGMGFSLHDTLILAGTTTRMCYRHHLEAVYCISGEGRIEVVATGEIFEIRPGTVYALDQHDEHLLHADSELRLVCVFNPALSGGEIHDGSGAYPPPSAPE